MIKNSWRAGLLCAVAAACGHGDPDGTDYQGLVELDEKLLAFEVAGRVEAVPVQRGDHVENGQILAKLDDALERLARDARADDANAARAELALLVAGSRTEDVASLAADVRAALATEDLARKTADRMRALHERDTVPQAEVDRANADLDRAVAQRKSLEQRLSALRHGARPQEITRAEARALAAKSALELEEARLARFVLRATGEGTVLDVHVLPGEMAAVGTPAATVADVSHPYVDVFVPQASIAGVRVGMKARVRVDGAPSPSDGAVEFISPKTEFTPRFLFSERERPHLVIRVRVRVEDRAHALHAGVPAFVRFVP